MKYVVAFLLSFLIVYLLIPVLQRFGIKVGLVDRPNKRKIHKKPIPLTGGIGIFIGFISVYMMFVPKIDGQALSVIFGALLVLMIGLVDDWYKSHGKDFPALPKMIIQVLAAIIVFRAGIVFTGFHNPFTNKDIILPLWLQFVFSITWVFGVTTVINFSDGMDGLAGGLTAISATTLFVVALTKGRSNSAVMAIILVGAALGFLRYNKTPAKIFMGDAGATFMGFILGVIALDGVFKRATVLSIFVPVLALGLPIFDNIFVVFKRIREKKPIYIADRSQLHFRLLSKGLTQKQVVLVLYLVSICFSLTSIIVLLIRV